MDSIRKLLSCVILVALILVVPASAAKVEPKPKNIRVHWTIDSDQLTQWALKTAQEIEEEKARKAEEERLAAIAAEEARVNRIAFPIHQDGWYVTTEYGAVDDVHGSGHTGIDFGNGPSYGWKTYPMAKGVVIGVHSFGGPWPGCGNYVIIWHEQLNLTTMYCHLAYYPEVHEGQWVDPDISLGEIGNTGYSFGIHLHFVTADGWGVENQGNFRNPREVLAQYGITF